MMKLFLPFFVLVVLCCAFLSETCAAKKLKRIEFLPPSSNAFAQALQLPRGRVIEKVAALKDAAESYALYLPKSYMPERRWPILYCLDPAARGSLPVERFSEAAEKYGWIVVGSNNSRNGALKPSLNSIQIMWADTHARFSIDERRTYMAGFSGGSRMAISMGLLCTDCLAGVIANSAGFPPEIPPSSNVHFDIYGMVGMNDFNFFEMKMLEQQLDKFSITHRLALFDGTHSWAPKEFCTEAVAWLELQAMKKGLRAKDGALIEELWQQNWQKASALEDAKKNYEAFSSYAALASDFKGLRDASPAEEEVRRLKESKEVKDGLRDEREQVSKQQELAVKLNKFMQQRTSSNEEERVSAVSEFKNTIATLKKRAQAEADTGERRVARRVLGQMSAQVYEDSMGVRASGQNLTRAVFDLEIANEINPDNPRLLYELACAYAQTREKKKALETLRRAVEKGFADAADLSRNKALDSIRGEASYKEIFDSLSKKQMLPAQ